MPTILLSLPHSHSDGNSLWLGARNSLRTSAFTPPCGSFRRSFGIGPIGHWHFHPICDKLFSSIRGCLFIDIVAIPTRDSYYAMHVPNDISVTVETAWGDVLHTNLPNARHGGGGLPCLFGAGRRRAESLGCLGPERPDLSGLL